MSILLFLIALIASVNSAPITFDGSSASLRVIADADRPLITYRSGSMLIMTSSIVQGNDSQTEKTAVESTTTKQSSLPVIPRFMFSNIQQTSAPSTNNQILPITTTSIHDLIELVDIVTSTVKTTTLTTQLPRLQAFITAKGAVEIPPSFTTIVNIPKIKTDLSAINQQHAILSSFSTDIKSTTSANIMLFSKVFNYNYVESNKSIKNSSVQKSNSPISAKLSGKNSKAISEKNARDSSDKSKDTTLLRSEVDLEDVIKISDAKLTNTVKPTTPELIIFNAKSIKHHSSGYISSGVTTASTTTTVKDVHLITAAVSVDDSVSEAKSSNFKTINKDYQNSNRVSRSREKNAVGILATNALQKQPNLLLQTVLISCVAAFTMVILITLAALVAFYKTPSTTTTTTSAVMKMQPTNNNNNNNNIGNNPNNMLNASRVVAATQQISNYKQGWKMLRRDPYWYDNKTFVCTTNTAPIASQAMVDYSQLLRRNRTGAAMHELSMMY